MLITNHVLSGAVVGAVAPSSAAAFLGGVASHFALDSVPHWGDDSKFLRVAVVDGLIGLAAMGTITLATPPERRRRVFAGMLGACVPDTDKPTGVFFGCSPFPAAVDDWHKRIQRESTRRMPQEIIVAVAGALVVRRVLRDRP